MLITFPFVRHAVSRFARLRSMKSVPRARHVGNKTPRRSPFDQDERDAGAL